MNNVTRAWHWVASLGLGMLLVSTVGCMEMAAMASGIAEAQQASRSGRKQSAPSQQTTGVITSNIKGTFRGWDGDTVFPLENGQVWQQASLGLHLAIALRPEVIIWKVGSKHRMSVEGEDEVIDVRRIK